MSRPSILVVDDDPASAEYEALTLRTEYDNVRTAADGVEALLAMEDELPNVVISDLQMPRMDGLELVTLVKQRWPELPVILVTVQQEVSTVVEAVQRGAINYLVKPASPASLLGAVRKVIQSERSASPPDSVAPELVGRSEAMVRVRHLVALAARSDVNLIITGETGTGKELVARAIHRLSGATGRPFVPCNCALVPRDLFESEFFGHRRGAFTGADDDREGLLVQADGGILFLDELETMSPPHQAKLLRVMDDGEVRPIGSNDVQTVSVRFLAATNREPLGLIDEGSLREDLYYRLRGLEIRTPPLRDRAEDIPLLAQHSLGDRSERLTPEALDALAAYPWPGNVRQLQNVLKSADTLAGGGSIAPRHLDLESAQAPRSAAAPTEPLAGGGAKTLKAAEREAVLQALRAAGGNRTRAARALGIDRSTLRRKMRDFGIRFPS